MVQDLGQAKRIRYDDGPEFRDRFVHWPCGRNNMSRASAQTILLPTILGNLVYLKKLVPLKHLVKLRKSCVQMILPDIRKCSNLVQNMVANRYSCFWGLGAIWQPLWLKNSHNMAIFHHFLTFSVTFLVAMTSFMHKTCTERTETFLIHRTIDEVPFLPFPGTYPGVQGSKKWLFYG